MVKKWLRVYSVAAASGKCDLVTILFPCVCVAANSYGLCLQTLVHGAVHRGAPTQRCICDVIGFAGVVELGGKM